MAKIQRLTPAFKQARGLSECEEKIILKMVHDACASYDSLASEVNVSIHDLKFEFLPEISEKLGTQPSINNDGTIRIKPYRRDVMAAILNQSGLTIELTQEDIENISALPKQIKQILRLVANGYSNRAIVEAGYSASDNAIKANISKYCKNLDISSAHLLTAMVRAVDVNNARKGDREPIIAPPNAFMISGVQIPYPCFEKLEISIP